MGLAFDLDALDIPGLEWAELFSNAVAGRAGYGGYEQRWESIFIDLDHFDCIIRDVQQFNGVVAVCGSYRARAENDPYGNAMDGKLFWDGFIAFQRGFKWTFGLDSDADGFRFDPFKAGAPQDPSSWIVIPMRMPFEVNPGTGFDDSAIGLYSMAPLKPVEPFNFDNSLQSFVGSPTVQVATCGFSAIDAAAEGAPTGQDYVGSFYILPITVGAIPIESGYWVEIFQAKELSAQVTWKCTQTDHIDNTPENARFGVQEPFVNRFDLDLLAGSNQWNVSNAGYGNSYPEAYNLANRNRYPRRFMDLSATSIVIPGGEPLAVESFGPLVIGGDCTYAPAGTVTNTFPLAAYFQWPLGTFGGNASTPYPVLACFTEENTQLEGGGMAAYDLDGAYFRYVIPTTDFLVGSIDPTGAYKPTLLLAENVTHGASKSAEIYIISGVGGDSAMTSGLGQLPSSSTTPPVGAIAITPYAVSGGVWETTTGITLPVRWTGYANQMRTFTEDEEFGSRNDDNTGLPEFTTVPDENGTLVGVIDNYPRFGFSNKDFEKQFTTGEASNQVLLLMGVTISGGVNTPSLLAFDDGTISAKAQNPTGIAPYVIENTGYVRDYGTIVRNQILTGSTNSYPVSASWDNDRDQWLILYTRTSGSYALISARSDFTQFIDQTPNLEIYTGRMGVEPNAVFYEVPPLSNYTLYPAGIYTARLMTNELDGLVIGGDFEDLSDATKTSAIRVVQSNPALPGYFTNFTIVRGTTGRTARVWVDYVLYDGVDALVATKLSDLGLRVTPENVEWFKGRILRSAGVDELDVKTEEIEKWMEAQRKEYTDMLRSKERAGRLRKRKRQVSAYREGVDGALADANKSSVDTRALDPDDLDDLLRDVGMPDDGYSSDRERS